MNKSNYTIGLLQMTITIITGVIVGISVFKMIAAVVLGFFLTALLWSED